MTLPSETIPEPRPAPTAIPPATRSSRRREGLTAAWMVSPAVILLILFLLIPVILAFTLAFTNARLISPRPPSFIGFENFSILMSDPVFWASLRNTLFFAVVIVPFQAGFALVLAILVNAKVRGTNFFRTIYFVPVVTSIVVVSLLWEFMYQPNGLLNRLLEILTFGNFTPIDWLNNPRTALPAIMFMSIWQAVGFHMIIWLSGLQTIPEELYEAARMDGASPWRQFTNVTWPGLRPTMVFVLVTITIAALGLFVQVDVMTQGGPQGATSTIVFHAVRKGYEQQEIGYAAAISLIFFVAVLIIALIQRRLTREKD